MKRLTAIVLFLGSVIGVLSYGGVLHRFIDSISVGFVVLGAASFGLAAKSEARVKALGTGALVSGILGGLLGALIMAATFDSIPDIPAAATIACLPPIYGIMGWSMTRLADAERS